MSPVLCTISGLVVGLRNLVSGLSGGMMFNNRTVGRDMPPFSVVCGDVAAAGDTWENCEWGELDPPCFSNRSRSCADMHSKIMCVDENVAEAPIWSSSSLIFSVGSVFGASLNPSTGSYIHVGSVGCLMLNNKNIPSRRHEPLSTYVYPTGAGTLTSVCQCLHGSKF